MLADATFLIDIMSNDADAIKKADELERMGIALLVGAPTIFELYVGVSMSNKAEQERSTISSVISSLAQVPFDYESARAAGVIYGDKMKRGSMIDPEDAMLAGISQVHGHPIITRNIKHFSNIEGVSVEGY